MPINKLPADSIAAPKNVKGRRCSNRKRKPSQRAEDVINTNAAIQHDKAKSEEDKIARQQLRLMKKAACKKKRQRTTQVPVTTSVKVASTQKSSSGRSTPEEYPGTPNPLSEFNLKGTGLTPFIFKQARHGDLALSVGEKGKVKFTFTPVKSSLSPMFPGLPDALGTGYSPLRSDPNQLGLDGRLEDLDSSSSSSSPSPSLESEDVQSGLDGRLEDLDSPSSPNNIGVEGFDVDKTFKAEQTPLWMRQAYDKGDENSPNSANQDFGSASENPKAKTCLKFT
ncbi:hypothetical protein DID73_02030 [Candidatus Marinamargulisbacteria bacterium SCGC AG-343-K17]|nr:hypothetical protein DID73_02030 [Candidatus Marinamargulisbacteria bacterium SCGC AG-343-K17]